MQDKFLSLSKGLRLLCLAVTWLLTILGFVGCTLLKSYYPDMMWAIILLTCVGMLFCVIAICLTIYDITSKQS